MAIFHKVLLPLLIGFCLVGAGLAPIPAKAEMTPLTENQMETVKGQQGLQLNRFGLEPQSDGKSWVYHDADGVDGNPGAHVTFNDVEFKGFYQRSANAIPGRPLADFHMRSFTTSARIDEFSIGAIQVGEAPGEGASFGAFQMHGLSMTSNDFVGIQGR